jgi:glyoxylase-like metal-dependent hydrolase (beta-lactamase superfamily II)
MEKSAMREANMFGWAFSKKLTLTAMALALSFGNAFALDATDVLQRASNAMGAGDLKSIRYTSTGSEFVFGQNATPGGPWPEYKLDGMISSFNYETSSSTEELIGKRTRVDTPPRGGGEPSLPRGITFVKDGFVWSQIGPRSISRPWNVEDRNHQIWTTPHGVIKAALKNKATLKWRTKRGKKFAVVSFTETGHYSATAYIDEDNLVERVESRTRIPFYGEMEFVTTYAEYKDYGGVKFPTSIQRFQGGYPILDMVVKEVAPNAPVDFPVPESLRQPDPPKTAVKVADGVWNIPGSANCVAIEMADHIVVVEAPLTNDYATAVFDAVKRAIPNKPIRYVINTHHHIDHTGGLRAAIAEGATIVTSSLNRRIFQSYFINPHKLAPNELAGKKITVRFLDDKLVLGDGARIIELYPVYGNRHADDLVMIYLPKEKILIEADAFSPGPPNATPPAQPDVFTVNLVDNIERLKLSIDHIMPLHGPVVPLSELYRMVGKTS